MIRTILSLSVLGSSLAHTVFMCIKPGVNEIVAYGGTYHTNSRVGGMIIAGGATGSEQYDPICTVPYGGYPSGSYAGEVPCSHTANGAQTWSCGQRFNWDTSTPLTHSQMIAEAPDANCDQVGNAGNSYQITSPYITWNRVAIPVDQCGEGINYALTTTCDSCDDTPWMNVWAHVECVPGDPNQTPGQEPTCSLDLTCPSDITVNANGQCQATVDVASMAQVNAPGCTGLDVHQDVSVFGLGTTEVTIHAHADGNIDKHCHMHVTVVDNQPPHLNVPNDTQVSCDSDLSTDVTGMATATDNCPGTNVTYVDSVSPGSCPQEESIHRMWVATDGSGNTVSSVQHINVVDSAAPVQTTPEDVCLWPPNHKFRCFDVNTFVSGTDNCGSVSVSLNSCTSSQPADSTGDGNFLPDCYFDATNSNLCFRAERKGDDPAGRTYTAAYTASDQCGNTAPFSRTVFVPHDEDTFDVSGCLKGTLKLDGQNGNKSSKGKRNLRDILMGN